MVRFLIMILLSLIVGMVINVAIAWWCTIRLDTWAGANGYLTGAKDESPLYETWQVTVSEYDGVTIAFAQAFGKGLRGTDYPAVTGDDVLPYWAGAVQPRREVAPGTLETFRMDAAGRPWRSLFKSVHMLNLTQDPLKPAWNVTVPGWMRGPRTMMGTGNSPVGLPLRPIWPGFLANTLLYGSISFVLLSTARAVRRAVRRRRGRCESCGYPTGTSAVCTECGIPIRG